MGHKNRDVEVVRLEQRLCLVTACDSCGGIGSKEMDILRIPARTVGQMTARLVLMEVLSTGALPRVMTVAVSSEPDPTGNAILEGVNAELTLSGFPDLPVAVSTEKNFEPAQTGLGIGLTGTCPKADLKIAVSEPGNAVYCLGEPLVGREVTGTPSGRIPGTREIRSLLGISGIREVLPVGSRGIRAEAHDLARSVSACFIPEPGSGVDLDKSAGPATCTIFTCADSTCRQEILPELPGDIPLARIGRLGPVR